MNMKHEVIKAGIFGGSGYGGSELLRLLLFHPHAEVAFVTAGEQAGKKVSDVHRNLSGITELQFLGEEEGLALADGVDVVFFALPHGRAMKLAPAIPKSVKAVDLSGDFRLSDAGEFSDFYGFDHDSHELQKEFVYGLTEINRDRIAGARLISNPGCFATAVLLALFPLSFKGLVEPGMVVDAKTGSSGSGVKPAANTHHPVRSTSFYAYKPFTHQHLPEIREALGVAGFDAGDLVFMTHSLPVARGIYASCYIKLKDPMAEADIRLVFEETYADCPFVRISVDPPNINWVKMTNYCDISVHSKGKEVAVFAAIDNLVKGAAGQAVQNMNLMFGFEEAEGLQFPGTNP